jgi:hypothetical protein
MTTATATETLFNLDHNLAEYNTLVGHKYSQTMTELQSYAKPSEKYTAGTTFSRDSLTEYAAVPKPTAKTAEPQTFRPKIFDTDMVEIDFSSPGLPLKNNNLNSYAKFGDMIVNEPIENIENLENDLPFSVRDEVAEISKAPARDQVMNFKLTPVGMCAVISFIVASVMVLAFIIVNGIKIGANAANITAITNENAALISQIAAVNAENAAFAASYEEFFLATHGITMAEYMDANGFVPVEFDTIPAISAWAPAANADSSTNLFDILSKFFTKWF